MSAQLNAFQKSQTRHLRNATPINNVPRLIPSRVLSSAEILAGQREVIIEHEGVAYRLRHTKNGKLILTK